MEVMIEEVVSNVRVVDRNSALDPRTLRQLIDAVLRAVDSRLEKERQRTAATAIDDDGRGGVSRQSDSAP